VVVVAAAAVVAVAFGPVRQRVPRLANRLVYGVRGSALQNMADRLDAHGGTLTIDSAPRSGTRITGRLPARIPVVGVHGHRQRRFAKAGKAYLGRTGR
jgi:hypothetical protein